jgi:AraC-like DNA-binding protein
MSLESEELQSPAQASAKSPKLGERSRVTLGAVRVTNAIISRSVPPETSPCARHAALAEAEPACRVYIPPSRELLSRRAEEYVRGHLDEAITIRKICQAVGGASRTLHIAFQECFGTSPVKYSRELRLNAERRQLLHAASGTTVTDVAMRRGFLHLGRFSQDYRRRFGECPSVPLHSHVSSVDTTNSSVQKTSPPRQNGMAA